MKLRYVIYGVAALAIFAAGWEANGNRLKAAWNAERADEAEKHADALEDQLEATRAAGARLMALRGDYDALQAELADIPDTGSCGLDRNRVRILNRIH